MHDYERGESCECVNLCDNGHFEICGHTTRRNNRHFMQPELVSVVFNFLMITLKYNIWA